MLLKKGLKTNKIQQNFFSRGECSFWRKNLFFFSKKKSPQKIVVVERKFDGNLPLCFCSARKVTGKVILNFLCLSLSLGKPAATTTCWWIFPSSEKIRFFAAEKFMRRVQKEAINIRISERDLSSCSTTPMKSYVKCEHESKSCFGQMERKKEREFSSIWICGFAINNC